MAITVFPLENPSGDPPIYYHEDPLFQLFNDLFSKGIVGSGDLAVSQDTGTNMSCKVAAGISYIDYAGTGMRRFYSDAISTSGAVGSPGADWIATFTAANVTNPRIDRIVATVRDKYKGDSVSDGKFQVIAGTPTAGATLVNLNGAAAVPANSILLANVLIPANATAVTNANIDTTVRTQTRVGAGAALPEIARALPATTVTGLGTGVDGRIGRIRAGITPFDFLEVTYDATYGKWVSELKSAYDVFQSGIAVATGYSYASTSVNDNYSAFAAAGLALYVRGINSIKATVADGAADLALKVDTTDVGTGNTPGTIFGSTTLTPNSLLYVVGDTGWLSAASFLTSRTYYSASCQMRKSSGTGTWTFGGGVCMTRWVA